MVRRLILFTGMLLLPASSGLAQPSRPDHWPDAVTVVENILAGRHDPATACALLTCPPHNPYGDTVRSALLGTQLPRRVAADIASSWTRAVRECHDTRVLLWLQTRLAAAGNVLEAGPYLLLATYHAPANIAFLKDLAFDGSRDLELRDELLMRLSECGYAAGMARGASTMLCVPRGARIRRSQLRIRIGARRPERAGRSYGCGL